MRKIFAAFVVFFVATQCCAFAARTTKSKQAIDVGTKIADAGTNSFVDTECSDSYFGCMDAFCVVENVSGGRCQCSNKHADLTEQLNKLLEKDENAVNLAQYGADFVKMGKATDTVLKDANNAKQKPSKNTKGTTLSRADWDAKFMTPNDDDEDEDFVDSDDISNKRGDALYIAANEMCIEQIPDKCKATFDMVKMLYTQKIKSDCVAFENSIKQQNIEITAKLMDAKKSVRDAALTEFANSNKYSLGECTLEFKTCMQTTAGCGDDFTKCVSLSANENVKSSSGKVVIHGEIVDTEISASTMDTLLSKKVLCEYVLDSCEKVKTDVWDVFLKNSAVALKTAEINSESNLRKNCIKNVSDCFIKSCREKFDVNEEKGSYDMCLARPENYKSFCKVELGPCLDATGGSYEKPESSSLWDSILATLSKMRVDACSTEFRACIQDKDRCGEDFSQCIGLDSYDIVDICPTDKLTACYREYNGKKETVEDTLATLAQGIMLGVESKLYDACQRALDEAMLKTCGDTESCDALIIGEKTGANTLELKFCKKDNGKYTNCQDSVDNILDTELGGKSKRNYNTFEIKTTEKNTYEGIIKGRILWDEITVKEDGSGIISVDDYITNVKTILDISDKKEEEKIKTEIGSIANAIKNTIAAVESDPKVQFCMTGRQVSGLTTSDGFEQIIGKENNQMFPKLSQSIRGIIINSAIFAAQRNYNEKYDKILKDLVDANAKLAQRYEEIANENVRIDKQEVARKKCIELGENGAITRDAVSKGAAKKRVNNNHGTDNKLMGYSAESRFNYKRQVTTTFILDDMICKKCTRTQKCKKTKTNYCKKWGDEEETCEDIKF